MILYKFVRRNVQEKNTREGVQRNYRNRAGMGGTGGIPYEPGALNGWFTLGSLRCGAWGCCIAGGGGAGGGGPMDPAPLAALADAGEGFWFLR